MTHLKVLVNRKNIDKIIGLIEKEIKDRKIDNRNLGSFLLYSEELLVQLIHSSENENSNIHIKISGRKKNVRAQFSCIGKELSFTEDLFVKDLIDKTEFDEEQTIALSKVILKANSEKINVKYKNGINFAQLNAVEKTQRSASLLVWMVCGLFFGFLLKLIGNAAVSDVFSSIFSTVSTMFMNAVKMLVTPLVFFLIADSVSEFSDISVFGRIGSKIVGTFIGFSAVAIMIALGVFSIIKPGDPALMQDLSNFLQTAETSATPSVSFLDTISDIVPSGFVSAFVKQNMTQIIFLSILAGFASGNLGQYSEKVQSFFSVGSAFFSKLIGMVIKTLKPVCFCILTNIALSIKASSLVQQFILILCILCGHVTLVGFYAVFIAVVSKVNPLTFFRKIKKAILVAVTTMSSSTTVPTSMQCCNDMGISPKVYSFSIPMGTTTGKNASCILMMVITLFIAKIMEISMTPISVFTLSCTILLLVICSPGIPGASLACLTIVFSQLGIQNGALGYILGVYTLVDGFNTAINVLGASVSTLVVAKSENMLDVDKFNS